MEDKGFIKLSRKFFEGKYWKQERSFSLAEAWIDLIQSARFEGTTETKLLANGRSINIKRGEIHASLRYLAKRWGWGVDKTKRFIDNAKKDNAIEHRTEQGESILTLCNYVLYNRRSNTDQYTDQYTDQTPTKQTKEREEREESSSVGEKQISPQTPISKKSNSELSKNQKSVKSEKKQRKKVPQKKESIEQRAEAFKMKIWQTAKGTDYERPDVLREFWEYWSEYGENDQKMRYEKQTSFSIPRRLGTWFRKEEEIKQAKKQSRGHPFTNFKQKEVKYEKF